MALNLKNDQPKGENFGAYVAHYGFLIESESNDWCLKNKLVSPQLDRVIFSSS